MTGSVTTVHEPQVGNFVTLREEGSYTAVQGYNHPVTIPRGTQGKIKRVTATKLLVAVRVNAGWVRDMPYHERAWHSGNERCFWIPRDNTVEHHGTRGATPKKDPERKLGEPPAGEGIISQDHPGIQWLWQDMAKFASRSSYCYEYDRLTAKLGIPGRERDITVEHTIGSLRISTTVRARSEAEAKRKIEEAFLKEAKKKATTEPEGSKAEAK